MLSPLLACTKPSVQPDLDSAAQSGETANPAAPGPAQLATEGERNTLPDGSWFTWKFTEKPKLGTIIVKVQTFGKDGTRETLSEVIGEFGMPSMRAHDSGQVKFQTNKKGDYLLPVNIVMVGEWELVIKVRKDKNEVHAARVLFTL